MLLCFAFQGCHNERDGYWTRCVTVRRNADGSISTRFNELSSDLAQRLAEKLCQRYGITDLAALFCGRIYSVAA
jgi:hypothetical protein